MHWSLLVMKSFSFCMPGKVFTFNFEKMLFKGVESSVDGFFFSFSTLKMSSHCLLACIASEDVFYVFCVSYVFPILILCIQFVFFIPPPMAAFKIYFLIPALPTSWMEFFLHIWGCVYVCLNSLNFLDLWTSFQQIWKTFQHYFFKFFPALSPTPSHISFFGL